MKEKRKGKMPIYRRRPIYPARRIRLNRKKGAKIKQSNWQWAFKVFEINNQDGGTIMGKRGTRALKAPFTGKRTSSPCVATLINRSNCLWKDSPKNEASRLDINPIPTKYDAPQILVIANVEGRKGRQIQIDIKSCNHQERPQDWGANIVVRPRT